jgi:hypothetical protein
MYSGKTYCNVIENPKMIVNPEKEPTMNTKHYWFCHRGVQVLEVSYE